MSNLEPGDLALCIKDGAWKIVAGDMSSDPDDHGPRKGDVLRVTGIEILNGLIWLRFDEFDWRDVFSSERFRKVRPDEQSGERQDWIDLLTVHSRPKVDA
jgi:hypothetical protein